MRNNFWFFLFLIIANLIFFIANLPIIWNYLNTPPKTFFPLVHQQQVDYYLYLAVIRESKDRSWSIPAFYTSENTKNSYLYIFLILVGKLAAILNISPILAYHLARVIATELMIVAIYFLCKEVLGRSWGFWAGIVSILATTPPSFLLRFLGLRETPWWGDVFDTIAKFNYLPHHAFGIALLFTAAILIFKSLKSPMNSFVYLLSILFSFVAALMFPPAGLVLALGLSLSGLLSFLQKYKLSQKLDLKSLKFIMMTTLVVLFALFFLNREMQKGFPWSQWRDWDKAMWNNTPNFNRDFIIGEGIILLAAMPSIMINLIGTKVEFQNIFLSIWGLLPYLLLPFADLLGVGKIRLAFMGNFLPLGILSISSCRLLTRVIQNKNFLYVFYLLLFIFYIVISIPVSVNYFIRKYTVFYPGTFGMTTYIPVAILRSMEFIDNTVPRHSVVLAEFTVGNMLPAFAQARSYFGHWTQTLNYDKKASLMGRFYQGDMSKDEAYAFLKSGNIDYIYLGIKEKMTGSNISTYQLPLKKIYNYENIEIYQVLREELGYHL